MVNFGESFHAFFKDKKLGKWVFDSEKRESFYVFSFEDFHCIENLGIVFNGNEGGLILGNLHVEGGIHLMKPDMEKKTMTYVSEMEGWEYLSAPLISSEIATEFERINSLEKSESSYESTAFKIPPSCKVVDTFNEPIALLILSVNQQQFVVNRFSTRKYINELIILDRKNNKLS